jgi:radical SAM superfamily enzyme
MATQDSPIQHGSDDATEEQKIAGLVLQTRADYLQGVATDVVAHLQQRLIEAGIELDRDRIEELAKDVVRD